MDKIGYWANISACISLTLYIWGNIIYGIVSLLHCKRYNDELFVWNPDEDILKNYYIVHKEEGYIPYKDGFDKLMISSDHVLLNIKAFMICYDRGKLKKGKEIFSYSRLSSKECILFSTLLPEGRPNVMIEWETSTYMKASLILAYNGKTGNIFENIIYKHTIQSFFYYLFNK